MATRNNKNTRNSTTNAAPQAKVSNGVATWFKDNALAIIAYSVQLLAMLICFIVALPK